MKTTSINPGPNETLKALSDGEVLKLSVKDPDCFGELVTRYERPFMRKALSILGNEEDAEDAVQETFVRAYAAAGRFEEREGATFSSWAYAILTNRCFTAYAKSRKLARISFDREPELVEMIPDEAVNREREQLLTREYVLSMLSRLPEVLRSIVTLRFIQGKRSKEIARSLGLSDGAVRARIHRAKAALRKINFNMTRAHDGDTDAGLRAVAFRELRLAPVNFQ